MSKRGKEMSLEDKEPVPGTRVRWLLFSVTLGVFLWGAVALVVLHLLL